MIRVECSKAEACLVKRETITSGMVGQPVKIGFAADWDGLAKTAVFIAGGKSFCVPILGETVIIPHELLTDAGTVLKIGLYGSKEDGTVVIPTIYCILGTIYKGASCQDGEHVPEIPPTPDVVAQIINAANDAKETAQRALDAVNNGAGSGGPPEGGPLNPETAEAIAANTAARHSHGNKEILDGITEEKVSEWDTAKETAVAAASAAGAAASAASEAASAANSSAGSASAAAGAATSAAAAAAEIQRRANEGEFNGAPGAPGWPGPKGEPGQDGTSPTVAVSDIQGGHLVTITDASGDHTFTVLDGKDGQGSGGVGGGLSASLKQNWAKSIRQETAFVSTSHPYTDALLSILEGGSSDGGDDPVVPDDPDDPVVPPSEDDNVSNETRWTNGVAYTYDFVPNSYVDLDGTIKNYNGWAATPYLYCEGASKLRFTVIETSATYIGGNGIYNCFYDKDKNFISSFNYGFAGDNAPAKGTYTDIDIPANACYFICSGKSRVWDINPDRLGPYLSATPIA